MYVYIFVTLFCSSNSDFKCDRIADVAVFDAGDVYTAGLKYDLIPFISEVYNLGEPEYYAVAVAKEEDPDTELTYLKGISSFYVRLLLDR
jgi:hypothetical protein